MRFWTILFLLFPIMMCAQTVAGEWTFDNAQDLLNATIGNDLVLVGSHTAVPGPDTENGAVNIGVGSHYRADHGIPANGGGTMVNEFSLVIDFKVNTLGQWYTFFQTNPSNTNDGDGFINPSGQIGVAQTGYSAYTINAGEWYRLIIAADLGSSYKYYLDGQLVQDGGLQAVDGRFSLYPANPGQPLLLFADDNGEDNPINIAHAAIYNGCLNASQVSMLGGYGHVIIPPTAEMMPFLQIAAPYSVYISWHGASAEESRVTFGTTPQMTQTLNGTVYDFNSTTRWHTVHLPNIMPNTEYYYQCHTGTQSSAVNRFRTPPAVGYHSGHFRFLIMGDSQSNFGVSSSIVTRVVEKLTELYGPDWHNEVQLLCHVGDTVGNGLILSSFASEFFIPFSPLSGRIPIMVAIGNHEMESPYYYQYHNYSNIGGSEGEKYYSFDLATMRFVFLNPNISTTTQTTWLGNVLQNAVTDENLDWIFTFSHMPAWSELWPDGNNSWAQNTVLPALSANAKAVMLAGGHSHNYERGFSSSGKVTTLITGGAGGTLDRWGMYANQQDYPNTVISRDVYNWVLVDVDLLNQSYQATVYSMGHPDRPAVNEIIDSWSVRQPMQNDSYTGIASASAATGGLMRLVGWQLPYVELPVSTTFELASDSLFSSIIHTVTRHNTNVYGDTGSPFWAPVDLNAGIDLMRYSVPSGVLQTGNRYWWRIRSRDRDLDWDMYPQAGSFIMEYSPAVADFFIDRPYGDYLYIVNMPIRFVETSVGEATSYAWDFDSDGTVDSTQRDPIWVYNECGVFEVTLNVTINGQIFSVTKEVYIVLDIANDDPSALMPVAPVSLYPNPCRDYLVLSSKNDALLSNVKLYNLKGQLVKTETISERNGRDVRLVWSAGLAPGVYLAKYSFIHNGRKLSGTRKILVR